MFKSYAKLFSWGIGLIFQVSTTLGCAQRGGENKNSNLFIYSL